MKIIILYFYRGSPEKPFDLHLILMQSAAPPDELLEIPKFVRQHLRSVVDAQDHHVISVRQIRQQLHKKG